MQKNHEISISESAASKIKEIMAEHEFANGLRIALIRTHCMGGRGYAYDLRFVGSPVEDDQMLENRGIRIYLDMANIRCLLGLRLDYLENASGKGFTIDNPNAISKCPCGHHDIFY